MQAERWQHCMRATVSFRLRPAFQKTLSEDRRYKKCSYGHLDDMHENLNTARVQLAHLVEEPNKLLHVLQAAAKHQRLLGIKLLQVRVHNQAVALPRIHRLCCRSKAHTHIPWIPRRGTLSSPSETSSICTPT